MVSIDFSGVDWYVILAVSLGKLIIFLFTLVVVLVISRGKSVGLAGLLAIFTSQSNDVALAYPVRMFNDHFLVLMSLFSLSSSSPVSRPGYLHLFICSRSIDHSESVWLLCTWVAQNSRKGCCQFCRCFARWQRFAKSTGCNLQKDSKGEI